MGINIKKNEYVIDLNENKYNEAMIDIYSDMPQLFPIEAPNLEEINKIIKLKKSLEKIELNSEFLWFIVILSICFGGVAGIMRMVYLLKK